MITIERRDTKAGQFLDITIDGIEIRDCRRVQGVGKNGPYDFISGPQRSFEKDGKKQYVPLVKFSDMISAAIISELDGGGSGGMDEPVFDPESEIPFLAPAHWRA